jgi:hypothetical protein
MAFWHRNFWRGWSIIIRRSKVDKRARAVLVKVGLSLAYIVGWLLWAYHGVSTESELFRNAAFYGLLFGSAGIVVFVLRRSFQRRDVLLTESVTGTSHDVRGVTNDVASSVREYLEERAMILSSLVARAASEITIQNGGVPPDAQVVTRQNQNEFLRRNGLWNNLERDEKDLVSTPDGVWTVDQHLKITAWWEQLHLLRWVLGIDSALVPLVYFPRIDSPLVREMVKQQAKRTRHRRLLRSWDVRSELDEAEQYAARLLAELKERSLIPCDPATDAWVDEVRRICLGPSEDLIAGEKTVGELSDEDLTYLYRVAFERERYAAYLVEQLNADHPLSFATWLLDIDSPGV